MLTYSNWTHFQSSYQTILTLSESYYQTRVNTFSEFISNITGTLRELLPNNTTHFSRYQAILTFSESYCQTILHTFPELTSNNTDISRWLLANNTTHFSRVYTKQYWHFQRVSFKLNYSKKFFQSSYHTILTLSESYYQTILTYLELISNSIHTFTELLPNSSKHFFESFNRHSNRQKILKEKIPK